MIDFRRDASNYTIQLAITQIDSSTRVKVEANLSQMFDIKENIGFNILDAMLRTGLEEFKVLELKNMGKEYYPDKIE